MGASVQVHETWVPFLVALVQCRLCHICVLYVTVSRHRVLTRHIFLSRNSAVIFKRHYIASLNLHVLCLLAFFKHTYIHSYIHTFMKHKHVRTFLRTKDVRSLRTSYACEGIQFYQGTELEGDRGGTVVNVLCYKSEGRWLDPSWCQWIFH